jgi:hypothetical protein
MNRDRGMTLLLVGFFVVLVVVSARIIGDALNEPSVADLQRRANTACGAERILTVNYHPGGWSGPSFETLCARADGRIYVVVTK